jgi:hypothetical protein
MLASAVLLPLLLGASAQAAAPIAAAADPDRVAVYAVSDGDYTRLTIPEAARTVPESPTRLVVFHGGRVIVDRGLRTDVALSSAPRVAGATAEREDLYTENAEVPADGWFGVLYGSRVRETLSLGGEHGREPSAPTVASTEIVWIDPEHPRGRWKVTLEGGRMLTSVVPISHAMGVAVSTVTEPGGVADLRIYDRDGKVQFTLPDRSASTVSIRATANGAFLAADLAYAGGERAKDRGILVVDLLQGATWTYAWSYGGSEEPLSWELLDSGILEVRTPAATLQYDRSGKPIGAKRLR